jgi:hypothetical protein
MIVIYILSQLIYTDIIAIIIKRNEAPAFKEQKGTPISRPLRSPCSAYSGTFTHKIAPMLGAQYQTPDAMHRAFG